MPTISIPYDAIVTVEEPVLGQRYFTWLPGRAGEVVWVTDTTVGSVEVTTDGSCRRLRRGTRRRWAEYNPTPEQGLTYITVEQGSGGTREAQAVPGEAIEWTGTMSRSDDFSLGNYIARSVVTERNLYVKAFVQVNTTPVVSTRIVNVSRLATRTGMTQVRVTHSHVLGNVGRLMDSWNVYMADSYARGVVVSTTRTRDMSLVAPDPGPGPYRLVEPTTVHAYDIYPLGRLSGGSGSLGTTVRVITSLLPDMVGTIMNAWDGYRRDTSATAVVLSASRAEDVARIIEDPGAGPYYVDTSRRPSRFTRRQEVVYVGSDPGVLWRAPTYAVVGEIYNSEDRNVELISDEEENRYQQVRDEDLVLASEYVDTRTPCALCGVQRCRCRACDQCGERSARVNLAQNPSTGYWYHEACTEACHHCAGRRPSTDLRDVVVQTEDQDTIRRYCTACARTCGRCRGTYVPPGVRNCAPCRRIVEDGVRHYGHTNPDMWLGGPLPKENGHQVGFYIGFELEVSSRDYTDITPLREWTEANMGNRRALDPKRDGSVEGFEIATQPMTPEFFESVDWDGFMENMNTHHRPWDTSESREPVAHGLHVHIGRVAFERDDIAMAMFTYLIGQGDHLSRIGRRDPTSYCNKVDKPASVGLVNRTNRTGKGRRQTQRIQSSGLYLGRDAINLSNGETIEIRAFRSTRNADHLRAAVRVVYLAARYIAHLRGQATTLGQNGQPVTKFVSPKALHWDAFMAWVEQVMPEAAEGLMVPKSVDADESSDHEYEDEDDEGRCSCGCQDQDDEEQDEVETVIAAPARISFYMPPVERIGLSAMIEQVSAAGAQFTDFA